MEMTTGRALIMFERPLWVNEHNHCLAVVIFESHWGSATYHWELLCLRVCYGCKRL